MPSGPRLPKMGSPRGKSIIPAFNQHTGDEAPLEVVRTIGQRIENIEEQS